MSIKKQLVYQHLRYLNLSISYLYLFIIIYISFNTWDSFITLLSPVINITVILLMYHITFINQLNMTAAFINHNKLDATVTIKLLTRAKATNSLWCNLLSMMSVKQFANLKGRNGMPKERMQNKTMQIKPTLNVKITLKVNC